MVKQDLTDARASDEADAIFKSAYAAGYTLQELGDLVGFTREYIRQRAARPVPVRLMRNYPPAPRVQRKAAERKSKRLRVTRILGLRVTSPALDIPVAVLNELAALHEQVTTVRGWTPLDAPARNTIKPYGDLLFRIVTEYEVPQTHLERLIGLKGAALTVYLRNHGYLRQHPSQKSYQGVTLAGIRKASGPKLVPGAQCNRGHDLTEANIGFQKDGRLCKTCRSEAAKRRYQERVAAKDDTEVSA